MPNFIYDCTPHFVHFDTKLTGKERDTESGLDYFGARYYGSSMGRFSSPDDGADAVMGVPVPFADLSNPQSLNLYSYVNNNPLSRRDYDGHASYQPCNGGTQQCWEGDYDGEVYCNTSSGCLKWNSKAGEWGAVPPKWMDPVADGIKPDNTILEWIVGGKVAEAGLGVIGGLAGRALAPAAEGAAGKGVQAVAKVLLKAGTKQLELARAVMGFVAPDILQGFTLFRRIPISSALTVQEVSTTLWEVEAALASVFFVGAQFLGRKKQSADKPK